MLLLAMAYLMQQAEHSLAQIFAQMLKVGGLLPYSAPKQDDKILSYTADICYLLNMSFFFSITNRVENLHTENVHLQCMLINRTSPTIPAELVLYTLVVCFHLMILVKKKNLAK